jgi:hypothetical protein
VDLQEVSGRLSRVLVALAAIVAAPAWADLFSPGELAPPHHALEGLSNCTKCHPAGAQLSQAECLACHTELDPSLKTRHGLHGRIPNEQRACEKCHHEHQGAATDLAGWGPGGMRGFDHTRTGWPLDGGHKRTDCTQCHERRLITKPVALELSKVRKTMLGLERECASCHFDEHRGQEKDECDKCHDVAKWKPAPKFDHSTTRYALKGKHKRVACEKCHPSERDEQPHGFPAPKRETFMKFTDIPFDTCNTCHRDPHAGKFGPRCESCHTVNSWTQIRSRDKSFHDKTRYPLEGAHLDVECEDCHGPWPGQKAVFKNMQFDQCTDCHADAHLGQLARTEKGRDCKACHNLDAFVPPQYGRATHNKTSFPLEGAHRVVSCDSCHPQSDTLKPKIPQAVVADLRKKGRKPLFSLALFDFPAVDTCDACHVDVHDGQFKQAPKGCKTCHAATSFTTLSFDHQKDSKFPLTGKHLKVACEKCHFVPPNAPRSADGVAVVRYKPLEQDCAACHEDRHAGQFARAEGERTKCDTCHETTDFKKPKFRHEPPFTDYRLEGKHAQVSCEKCHPKVKVGSKLAVVRYTQLPTKCAGCHSDFHQGAFQGFAP